MDPLISSIGLSGSAPQSGQKPRLLKKGFSQLLKATNERLETEQAAALFEKERSQLSPVYLSYADRLVEDLLKSKLSDLKSKRAHCTKVIGRLLFLSRYEAPTICPSEAMIQQILFKKLEEIKSILITETRLQMSGGVQNGQDSYTAALPLKVARILLLNDGTLNVGLIDDIKEYFFSSKTQKPDGTKDDVDWEVRTKETLKALAQSRDFITILESIEAPDKENVASSNLIRISLGLSIETPVTNYHTRLVALATLLSAVRQGPVGNCFVICNIIWFLTTLIGRVLSDFKTLLEEGALIRNEEMQKKTFPFFLNIANSDLDETIYLSPTGMIGSSLALWQIPGIINASNFLGANNSQVLVMRAISLYGEKKDFKTTPRDLLEKMATVKKQDKTLAWLAFSATTSHPLHHAYASALASIDQSGKNRYLKEKLNKAEKETFKPLWNSLKVNLPLQNIRKIKTIFKQVIKHRLLIEYDESVVMESTSKDEKSTAGSFIYFEIDSDLPSSKKMAISSSDHLKRFYQNSMNQSFTVLKHIAPESLSLQTAEKVKKVALTWINNPSFLPKFFANYDETIDTHQSTDAQFKQFSKFGQIGGDNGYVFLQSAGIPLPQPETTSGNAEERLSFIVKLLRKLEERWHFLENDVEGEKVMMDSDTHAFSLDLENKYIRPWITSDKTVETLIQEKMIAPIQSILKKEVTDTMRLKMESIARNLIPEEFRSLFDREAASLKEKKVFQPFSESLLKLVLILNVHLKPDDKGAKAAKFTNAILSREAMILSDAEFHLLESTTLPIPDTNWKSHSEDNTLSIYFGFAENPITQKIEVFEINENQTGLKSVNQKSWASGPWTFYTVNLAAEAKKWSRERLKLAAV